MTPTLAIISHLPSTCLSVEGAIIPETATLAEIVAQCNSPGTILRMERHLREKMVMEFAICSQNICYILFLLSCGCAILFIASVFQFEGNSLRKCSTTVEKIAENKTISKKP